MRLNRIGIIYRGKWLRYGPSGTFLSDRPLHLEPQQAHTSLAPLRSSHLKQKHLCYLKAAKEGKEDACTHLKWVAS